MALVVEDGTGLAGANSYVSIAEASTYWSDRAGTDWEAAEESAQSAALIKATAFVDGRYQPQFIGCYPVQQAQALLWPRVDAVDSRGYPVTAIPNCLKAAVCEAARLFLTEDLTAAQERGGAVKRVKVGPVEQEFADSAPAETVYPAVELALRPILTSSAGSGSVKLSRG